MARYRNFKMVGATPNILWFLKILFLTLKHRKTTFGVIWLQNTIFSFKKYQVDLILSANHSAHTSNIKLIFPPKALNPP